MKKLILSALTGLLTVASAAAFEYTLPTPVTVTQSVTMVRFDSVNFGTLNNYLYATNPIVTTNLAVTGLPNGSTATNVWYATNLLVTATATNTEFWAEVNYQWLGPGKKYLQQGNAHYSQSDLTQAMSPYGPTFLGTCSNLVSSLGAGATMQGQIQLQDVVGTNRLLVFCQYQNSTNGTVEQGMRRLDEGALRGKGVNCDLLVTAILAILQSAVH